MKGSGLKKILHLGGVIVSIVCCFYVGANLLQERDEFNRIFLADGAVLLFTLCIVLWVGVNTGLGVGYGGILRMMGSQVRLRDSLYVSYKSQVGKYLPGNIFHLIGRVYYATNIGVDKKVSSIALVLETVFLAGIALAIGYGELKSLFIPEANRLIELIVCVTVVTIIVYFFLKYKKQYYKTKWLFLALLGFVPVFFLQAFMFHSFNFFINKEEHIGFFTMLEMSTLSWLAGYLTIGSPGGIGVRELVFAWFADGDTDESKYILIAALVRVCSIAGDLISFFVGSLLRLRF